MKYDTAIFDFDGTVFDTGEGITTNIARTLAEMNYPPLPSETLKKFIGPSLLVSFKKYCGMDDQTAMKAIYVYRREYDENGYKFAKPYPGIFELIEKLRSACVKTVVASAKPQYILDPTVRYFNLNKYFDKVVGAEQDGRPDNDKKTIVARGMLGKKCIMIGDSPYDIQGGKDNGLDTIAVTYGFGFTTREEAEASHPTFIAENAADIEKILFN